MSVIDNKLINYGNLAEFHSKIIDDSSVSTLATWSSQVINNELADKQDVLTAGAGIDISNGVISATGGGGSVDMMVEVTYAELKALRDNSQLVPGQQYRITDYVTTTAQANTQSAGHQFDIIVVADSEDKLNENARAINHPNIISAMIVSYNNENMIYVRYPEGDDENGYAWAYNYDTKGYATLEEEIEQGINWDNIDTSDIIYTDTLTPSIGDVLDMSGDEVEVMDFSGYINLDYFANSKLDAWELKYCLDNDTNRFSWAQQTEKIDKIQVTYDDNSGTYLCLRYPNNDRDGKYAWALVNNGDDKDINNTSVDWTDIMTQADTNFYTDSENPSINDTGYQWNGDYFSTNLNFVSERNIVPAGKGIIYYMKDEWNNECPYDFKNIQFQRKVVNSNGYYELDEQNGINTWLFTFAANEYDMQNDSWSGLLDGSLESPYMHITDMVGGTYINNTIKPYIEFYPSSEEINEAGLQYLNDIVFIGYYNTNPSDEDWATPNCSYNNTFEYNCHNNTFGNNCYSNTFGNNCHNNTFGNNCYFNTFGNNCYFNTFEDYCNYNTFGNECSSNIVGNNCSNNTFGNNCSNNTFGDTRLSNIFGNNCSNNNFTSNYGTSTLQYVNVLSGYSANGAVPSGIVPGVGYLQIVGKNSQGVFTVKNPLD